ncbi:MAG: PilZ domain-containing protein [Phycisphaerales bacterium]
MSSWEALRKLQYGESREHLGARARPRFMTNLVTCGAAKVADVSAGGLRVISPTKPPEPSDEKRQVTVESPWGSCSFDVRIVWTRKIGWRKYESGLAFVDPDRARGLLRICWNPITGPEKAA